MLFLFFVVVVLFFLGGGFFGHGFVISFLYPLLTFVCGGCTVFTLSVHPSERPSVRPSVRKALIP